jgi:hypothetical protein
VTDKKKPKEPKEKKEKKIIVDKEEKLDEGAD